MAAGHGHIRLPVPWWVTQLVHILVVAPFLLFVGVRRPRSRVFYWILGLAGVLLLAYFTVIQLFAADVRGWLLVHAYLFSALLLYMAWEQDGAADFGFSLLVAIGAAAAGYHAIGMLTA